MAGVFVLNSAVVLRQRWFFSNLQVLKDSVNRTYPRAQINYKKLDPEAGIKETTIDVVINGQLEYQVWWEQPPVITRPQLLV